MLDRDPVGPYVTKSILATRAYLKRNQLSIPKFCELRQIDRLQMQRILNGEQRKVSVDFAVAIHDATDGEIDWKGWAENAPSKRLKRRKAA